MNKVKKFENYSNTVFDQSPDSRNQSSIFVSIVSYRDSNVINCVKSLLLNAKRPRNINISVAISCIQNYEDWVQELIDFREISNAPFAIKVFEADEKFKFGELKAEADSEYNKENYYMSVHSSTEFDPHWDDILIKQYTTVCEVQKNNDIVFTADPRGFLPHDDPVDGYVYFTNHNTRVSFQREDYDGSKIPVCGFDQFVNSENIHLGDESEEGVDYYLENLSFLKDTGIPKFSNRKFKKDEVLAVSLGFSSKFVFANARNYLKTNSSSIPFIDEEDFNFFSYLNLLKNRFVLMTPRWLPLYHLYERRGYMPILRKSPKDFYESISDLKNEESFIYLNKMIQDIRTEIDDAEFVDYINHSIPIDWEELEFKTRSKTVVDPFVECVNLFVSAYNFSTNENRLHWNKRDLTYND